MLHHGPRSAPPYLRPLKMKGFKEERVTTIGLDDIGKSTTLESNMSDNPLARFANDWDWVPLSMGSLKFRELRPDGANGADIEAKIPASVARAKMPENPCITGLSGQDDMLI